MKRIPLTRGLFALVDDEVFLDLGQIRWWATKRGKSAKGCYAIREGNVLMHREVAGAEQGEYVDHIDGNGLNNQRSNLRICSHSENLCNRGATANSRSGVKGVRWKADKEKWQARIMKDGKERHLGYFDTMEEAEACRKQADRLYHGEFAPKP